MERSNRFNVRMRLDCDSWFEWNSLNSVAPENSGRNQTAAPFKLASYASWNNAILGRLHKLYRTKIMSKLQFHIINGWMKMQGTTIRLYEMHRQRATNEKAFMWLGIAPVCSLYSCSHTYASHRIRFRFFSMFIVLDACIFFRFSSAQIMKEQKNISEKWIDNNAKRMK